VAFDLPTHRGYDSDHILARADVGKAGVAIDSVEDMKRLFKDIPLDQMSVSMTMNGAVLPIMAFYIVAAEEQGTPLKSLSGTIQNDILKEFLVRNTYIYPPEPSLEIISHIFQYTAAQMPKFNSISISGYHMQEAGATTAQELAYTIANGLAYVKSGIDSGLEIDQFAPRLSFFWGIGMDPVAEIAKLRASRTIWASKMQQWNPKNPKSLMLRAHCQTSGWSLAAQDPFNNVTRTTVEAMAAVLGGTQSLHTNALDEAIALPTDFSARIARNTQIFLQEESGIKEIIDPLGGSLLVEQKTADLIAETEKILSDIEKEGGIIQWIKEGKAKTSIEEAATLKQANIDNSSDILVGVNTFNDEMEPPIDHLEIDNLAVLEKQKEQLKQLKSQRDESAVKLALLEIEIAAKKILDADLKQNTTGQEKMDPSRNLLHLSVIAARKRATLGEISQALEHVFGRYKAKQYLFSGVYSKGIKSDKTFELAREKVQDYLRHSGRRPRIMLAKIGQDGHDRGIKIVATSLADIGFDVDLGPLFQTAENAVKQAIENDVHFLGISSLAGGHKTILQDLQLALKKANAFDIKIVLGGIIPIKDTTILKENGAKAVFGPGVPMAKTAIELLEILASELE
ncbi:methylmalonyl-CoA mutase, partial [Flavobacteriaceae bacterium]|nr:methylmalonyl-CoA mutase [Flavobacteriaceae bacterium]